jgi:iron-sulfur cluster repair protein YtfE (RIC family)
MDVMDVLDHLEEEHRKVEQLLDQLAESDPGAERKQLVGKLEEALNVHMVVEEQFLYPVVLDVLGEEAATEAEVEHDLAREGITKLHALADQPGFGAAVDMVKAGIGHHVEEEESEMFPELRQNAAALLASMDAAQLEAGGEEQRRCVEGLRDDQGRAVRAGQGGRRPRPLGDVERRAGHRTGTATLSTPEITMVPQSGW